MAERPDLDGIRERLAKIIPPFVVDEAVGSQVRQPGISKRRRIICPPDADGMQTADFIAHAPEDLAAFLGEAVAHGVVLNDVADLLADVQSALSGGGRLDSQSLHIGTHKRYLTLVRDMERRVRAALPRPAARPEESR